MNSPLQSNVESGPQGRWSDIFKGRLGVYNLVINLGTLLFAIDTFVVATILPTIVDDIGGVQYYSWNFSLFAVGSIIGAASASPVRDTAGQRTAYAGAGLIFLVGILGSALAPNMLTVVAFRFLQGIGGGAILSQGYGLVGGVFPEHLRSRVLSVVSTTWGVATLFGPAFGGIFAEFGSWRGAFWALAPFAVVFVLLSMKFVIQTPAHGRLSGIPYTRLGLLAASVLCLSATSQIDSNPVRVILIILSVIIAIWAFRRDATAKTTILPRQAMVFSTEIGAVFVTIMLLSVVIIFVNAYATLYLQVLHGLTPIVAAYIYAIMSFCWTLGALIVAPLQGRAESVAVVTGLAIIITGALLLAIFVVSGPVWILAGALLLIGTGVGLCNNPLIQRAIIAAPPEEKALAGASTQTMRTLGISFGAAAVGLVAAIAGLTADPDPATVATAMTWVFWVTVGISILALISSIPMLAKGRARREGTT